MQGLLPSDPQQIGDYRLTGRLGSGGMGDVYLGHSRAGRAVAVKVVRPGIADEPGFRDRFRREVGLPMKVGGFWTAAVVDADPDAPTPWVASQYVPGPSLAAVVAGSGPMAEQAVRFLGAGLAEALAAFHQAGLVHRDLKPANILLAQDGPRVIDFGISRALDGSTALTSTGTVMGTPGFMSPEQAVGDQVGPASDVFSLGAVLAYAATGTGPFGQGPTHALLYRVVHDEPDLSAVPEALRPVVADCLAKQPAARADARALVDRLRVDAAAGPPASWPAAAEAASVRAAGAESAPAGYVPTYAPTYAPAAPPQPHAGAATFRLEERFGNRFRRYAGHPAAVVLLALNLVALVMIRLSVITLAPLVLYEIYALVRAHPFRGAARALQIGPDGLRFQDGSRSCAVPWWQVAQVSSVPAGRTALAVTALLRDDAPTQVPAWLRRRNPLGPRELHVRLDCPSPSKRTDRAAALDTALRTHAPAA